MRGTCKTGEILGTFSITHRTDTSSIIRSGYRYVDQAQAVYTLLAIVFFVLLTILTSFVHVRIVGQSMLRRNVAHISFRSLCWVSDAGPVTACELVPEISFHL